MNTMYKMPILSSWTGSRIANYPYTHKIFDSSSQTHQLFQSHFHDQSLKEKQTRMRSIVCSLFVVDVIISVVLLMQLRYAY